MGHMENKYVLIKVLFRGSIENTEISILLIQVGSRSLDD
jgi:hypothetical protein